MGVVGGIITPDNNYRKLQPLFRRSRGSFTPEMAELDLIVQLENGCYLIPLGALSINDYEEFPDEITLDVLGIQRHVIEDFFLPPSPKPFLKEPWYPLDIKRKKVFEEELKKEISRNQHKLAGFTCTAYANYGPDDDVLFYISDKENDFAVVHLTWIQKPETSPAYPDSTYYSDFEEFVKKRMDIDVNDWD